MRIKKISRIRPISLIILGLTANLWGAAMNEHNVVWDTPSKDEHGSMPIGNGDLAANVWVEPNGDLVFYISKSDAWSGNGRLLKLGRVRVRTEPAFFSSGATFKQELDLETGTIQIQSIINNKTSTISFWIDANRPVIHVECDSDLPMKAAATLEMWRTTPRKIVGQEMHSARGLMKGPEVYMEPDTILPAKKNTLRWYHRNQKTCYNITLEKQHLGHLIEKHPDPLMNKTFGGVIEAEGMISKDDKTLETENSVKHLHLKVYAFSEQSETVAKWENGLEDLRADADKVSLKIARKEHESYWQEFWDRSWVFVSNQPVVTRAYVLQHWIQACAGRGKHPIKFNGSLFTVAGSDKGAWDADYRRWGGCYWFQNTRLPYWSMLNSGDFDQMEPFWKMYRDALPLLKDRVKKYYNHDGIFCSETMYFWGTYANTDFGWKNKGLHTQNAYVRYYWDSGNELSMMMLDYYHYTQDAEFVKTTLLPIADAVVTFYDQHYKRNAEGEIHFTPAMSLETWHVAEDPLPIIVGLNSVLSGLIDLPENLTTEAQRKLWLRLRCELPELPMKTENGKTRLLPARTYSRKKNTENPELYSVFPYRAYTMHKPDLDVALETWRRRLVKRTGGWTQDPIQAALLGLTDQAKGYVVSNAKKKHSGSRFPAFWGPNFDWIPDQDHGSVTMIALQRMLMQCEGDEIYLMPAWPKDWDVDFKLHAPLQTTVEGRVEGGKVIDLKVTPESRRNDVIVLGQK